MLDQPPVRKTYRTSGSYNFCPFLQKDGIDPRQALEQAENELRLSQVEFDRQVAEIKLRYNQQRMKKYIEDNMLTLLLC